MAGISRILKENGREQFWPKNCKNGKKRPVKGCPVVAEGTPF
jgi:hypothetical protein